MAFVNGRCPLCGNSTIVPDDREQSFCQSCGKQILTAAAIAFASADSTAQEPRFTVKDEPKESAPVSVEAPSSGLGDKAAYSEPVYQATAAQEKPLLDKWDKTPMGPAILGAIFPAPAIVMSLILALVASMTEKASANVNLVAIGAIVVVYCAVCAVYALWVYPSLITDKPKLKSPTAAAYWNLAFGGIIFGSIWCSALTNKRKSNSQYVYIALLVVSLVLSLVSGYFQGSFDSTSGNSGTYGSSITSTTGKTGSTSATGNPNVKTQTYTAIQFRDSALTEWVSANGDVTVSSTSIKFNVSVPSKRYNYMLEGTYLDTRREYVLYKMNDGKIAGYTEEDGIKFIDICEDKGISSGNEIPSDDNALFCFVVE